MSYVTGGSVLGASIENAELADGAVTLAKLDTGLATWTLIEEQTSSSSGVITWNTNLGTYEEYLITGIMVKDATDGTFGLRFNGDTGTNYESQVLTVTGSTVTGAGSATDSSISGMARGIASEHCFIKVNIIKKSGKNPVAYGLGGGGGYYKMSCGEWNNTAALTSIILFTGDGDVAAGTSLTLMGRNLA